jgi:hypothetical protein
MDIVKVVTLSILRQYHQDNDVIWYLYDADGLKE